MEVAERNDDLRAAALSEVSLNTPRISQKATQIHMRKIGAALMLVVLGCSLSPGLRAQHSENRKMPDRLACKTVKDLLPKAKYLEPHRPIIAAHLTLSGITLNFKTKPDLDIAYSEAEHATNERSGFARSGYMNLLCVHMLRDKKKEPCLYFEADSSSWQETAANVSILAEAVTQLVSDTHDGHPFVCSDDPHDYSTELAAFEQKTAASRALATKPANSDEVYKDRLLAEDALKNKDLNGALRYYEAGVASNPAWAQGWYNAALLYAEQKDYFDAAYCMKHYVILAPDAPDAQTAKDNIILWEAKAQTAKP